MNNLKRMPILSKSRRSRRISNIGKNEKMRFQEVGKFILALKGVNKHRSIRTCRKTSTNTART